MESTRKIMNFAMNKSKIVPLIVLLRRMSGGKPFDPLAGIHGKIKIMKQNESEINIEDLTADDTSELEPDFMNVGESHKAHERETQRQKEILKQQIVKQKYFQEKEPRFLTYAEKQLICKLHEHKPEEWTIEKLSQSFPALPETIKKILSSKWSPKSIKRVIEYDNVAVENWKKFHLGQLALSSELSDHLKKFKTRKIILTDREQLAKQFVQPKLEFKKPKSQLFSSFVQSYLDKEQQTKANLLSQENSPDKVIDTSTYSNNNQALITDKADNNYIAVRNSEIATSNKKQIFPLTSHIEKEHTILSKEKKNQKKPLTFDEFVKANLENIQKESPEEGITLLNTYRQQMDARQEMQTAEVVFRGSNEAMISTEENTLSKEDIQQYNKNISKQNNKNTDITTDKLDSSIKVWNKKIDTECDYAKPIKIAKHLYKPGKTYRISDCYYDDDGEFLYRVPCIKS
ncbi:uncharacterized protein LOC109857695 [Pseudomyrmex gracilis]|uniref:uncharacterized protein LOC109857695 n=1 Tax=Pseudomyrmex gracilis TaxID=219809 RepID=UPI00099586B3|nr:uncharacterized protein LOC109857695 [Pseudomyrmex gracilis]